MSPEILPTTPKPTGLLDEIHLKPLTQEQKALVKPLISPAIKHVLASKLNNLTRGKIKCIRNWQESSGKALLQKINDTFSPILQAKLQDQKLRIPEELFGAARGVIVKKTCEPVGNVADWTSQAIGAKSFCEKFINVNCDILSQTENDVPPQTVNRLITIAGVAYSGNENVKAIIDTTKATVLEEIFKKDGILSKELNKKLGSFAKPVEKLIAVLGIKGTVDNFLTERVLQDKSVEKVLEKNDVYDKLILKGVSHFIEIHGGERLTLDDLLTDETLEPKIKEQLEELQKLQGGMLGRITGLLRPTSLTDKLLTRLKDKDILRMSREEMKEVLEGATDDYKAELKTGFEDGVREQVGRLVTTLGSAGTTIVGVLKRPLASICEAGKEVMRQVASCARSIFNWAWGNSKAKTEEELDKSPESPEPTRAEQEIEETSVEVIAETENKNGKTAKEEMKLEEDFGEYLQNLFAEEPEDTSKEEPSKIPTESTEQNTDIGSVVLDKATGALALGLKGVGKTIETAAPAIEAVGKGVWWTGEKLVGLGKWMFGSSSKNEAETSSPENKEENKAEAAKPEETAEVPISEQQNLPKEVDSKAVAVQPNVVEDAKQITITPESEKIEIATPVTESKESPKTQEDGPSSELKEAPTEKTPEDLPKAGNGFSWWNPLSWWR